MTDQPTAAAMSAAAFMASSAPAAAASHSGNDPQAVVIAAELREVVRTAAEYAPRQVQVHLGPSELGVECDRQVVHKLLQLPDTNHVTDPWPSIVGTAVHAWLADAFTAADPARWIAENRVSPVPEHPGTADLYDTRHQRVIDHKCLGSSTHDKLRTQGPPRHYYVQLLLYALGYIRAGFPVTSVAIAAWPRTGSNLAGLYVWHHVITDADWDLVSLVLKETKTRKDYAALVQAGLLTIDQVPRTPTDGCYFCPAYRPEAARDGGPGCPGQAAVAAFR